MIGIVVTFLIAILGLTLLAFCFSHQGAPKEQVAPKQDELPVVGLSAISQLPLNMVFGKEDYHKLRTKRELRPVSEKFWRDRRRIVLMWLAELQKDVHTLWRFRRFSVRNGLQVTLREETVIVFGALLALLCLKIVRAGVFLCGPFAWYTAALETSRLVAYLSVSIVAPLARVSAPRKAEIEHRWSQQLLAMDARSG